MGKPITVLARCCFVTIAFFVSTSALANLQPGTAWLLAQQSAEGAFYTEASTSTPYQATAETLRALQLSGVDDALKMGAARAFLQSHVRDHVEYQARYILLGGLTDAEISESFATILEAAHQDGGVGDFPGHEGAILSTAHLLLAWSSTGQPRDERIGRAVNFLLSSQQPDGGWGEGENASSVYVTAFVVRSLHRFRFQYNLGLSLDHAIDYLLARKTSDGAWGSDLDTAAALLALAPLVTDYTQYQVAIQVLSDGQGPDGAWGDDVYVTALALQALLVAENPLLGTGSGPSIVGGTLVGAESRLPLADATVKIFRDGDLLDAITTNTAGRFRFSALSLGSYTLEFTLAGFSEVTKAVIVESGQYIDLGSLYLSLMSGRSLVAGVIRDATTGEPVSGATLSVEGTSAQAAISDTQGRYAVVVDPGMATVSVEAQGYAWLETHAFLPEGETRFYPMLYKTGDDQPPQEAASLQGMVLDAENHAPITNVEVRTSSATTYTDSLGKFEVVYATSDIEPTSLVLSRDGYTSATLNVLPLSIGPTNIGSFYLRPEGKTLSLIKGVVLDRETGEPLSGVRVAAGEVATITDSHGNYVLENLEGLNFSLTAEFLGYLTDRREVSLTEAGAFELNLKLEQASTDGVSVVRLRTDKEQYSSYEQVGIEVTLNNTSVIGRAARLYVSVYNASGALVDQYPVVHETHAGHQHAEPVPEAIELFPGAEVVTQATWHTDAREPGHYRIVVQAFDAHGETLLSEREVWLEIKPVENIQLLLLTAEPAHFLQGTEEEVRFALQLLHNSNLPCAGTMSFSLRSPSGELLYQDSTDFQAQPEVPQSRLPLKSGRFDFSNSGAYELTIEEVEGCHVEAVESRPIYVASKTRVSIGQKLVPSQVLPGENSRLGIEILIQGESE